MEWIVPANETAKNFVDLGAIAPRRQEGLSMTRYRHADLSPRLLSADLTPPKVPAPAVQAGTPPSTMHETRRRRTTDDGNTDRWFRRLARPWRGLPKSSSWRPPIGSRRPPGSIRLSSHMCRRIETIDETPKPFTLRVRKASIGHWQGTNRFRE